MAERITPGDDHRDREVAPIVRAASAAAIITAGMGLPSVWSSLQKSFPNGLTTALANQALKRQATTTEVAFILGKAAIELHKDPNVIGSIAESTFRKRTEIDKNISQNIFDNERMKQILDIKKSMREADRTEMWSYLSKLNDMPLQEKIRYVEEQITKKRMSEGFGTNIDVLVRAPGISNAAVPGAIFTHPDLKSSVRLKANIVLNTFRGLQAADISAICPSAAGIDLMELSQNYSDDRLAALFDETIARNPNHPGVKSMGETFMKTVIKSPLAENGIIMYPKHDTIAPLRMGNLSKTLLGDLPKPIGYMVDENTYRKKYPKGSIVDIMFQRDKDLVDNVLAAVEMKSQGALYSEDKEALKRLMSGLQNEFQKLDPSQSHNKGFRIRVNENTQMIEMIGTTIDNITQKEKTFRAALPMPQINSRARRGNIDMLLTRVVPTAGEPAMVSSYARSVSEISHVARSIISGLVKEPRFQEDNSINSMINKLFEWEMPSANPRTNFYKTEMARSRIPLAQQQGRFKMNRINGLTQHTILQAAKRRGQDILMYDQEFFFGGAGREGPQVVAKKPHMATPYQISYRKISASGDVVAGDTLYIRTKEMDAAFRAYKAYSNTGSEKFLNNRYLSEFRESLGKIGRGEQWETILNEVITKGVTADKAYTTVFAEMGKNCVFADYNGMGGPDREIVKLASGTDYIGKSASVDVMSMLQSVSSQKKGWSLVHQFQSYMDGPGVDFAKVEKIMLSHAGSIAHRNMVDKYKRLVRNDPHNRRQYLIEAALSEAHDASVDTAMQTVLFQKIYSNHTIMGASGSFIDKITRLQNNPTLDFRQKIALMTRANVAAHFYGDTSVESDGYNNIMPTGRSDRMLMRGTSPGVGINSLDIFSVANSGLKQVHQHFYGLPLSTANRAGKFLDPFSTAFQKQMDHFGTNAISSNIAFNAEPVMSNVYLVPKGYGMFPDDSIIGEKKDLRGLMRESESDVIKSIRLGKSGVINDPHINNFLREFESKYIDRINAIGNANFRGTKQYNELLMEHLTDQKTNLYKEMEAGIIEAGSTNKYHKIEQHSTIVRNLFGKDVKNYGGAARISHLAFLAESNGEMRMEIKFAELLGLDKTWVGGSKSLTNVIDDIENVIGSRDHIKAGDMAYSQLKPKFAAASTLFSRGEAGTAKKVQAMRIWTSMMATSPQKATNFLSEIGFKNIEMVGNTPRVKDVFHTVEQQINAMNNISSDKLYQGMIDAGLTWNRHDVNLMKEFYKISHLTDQQSIGEFDRIVYEQWNKREKALPIKVTNYTTALNDMMDNTELRTLRGIYNPFFNQLNRKIVNPMDTTTPTGRFFDPNEIHGKDGKLDVVMGIRTAHTLEHIITQSTQVPGTRRRWLHMGSYLDEYMKGQSAVWENSIMRQMLLKNNLGAYKHTTRKTTTRYLSTMMGTEALENKAVRITGGLDEMLRRTATYRNISKDVRDGVISRDMINHDTFKDYYRSYDFDQALIYEDEAQRLLKLSQGSGLTHTEKRELQKKSVDWHKKAKALQSKDYGTTLNMTIDDMENNVKSLWEKIETNSASKEFPGKMFSSMTIGDKVVAPTDLILLQTNINFTNIGNRDFWKTVVDQADEVMNALGKGSPQVAHQRETVARFMKALSDSVQSGAKGQIILPAPQLIASIQNLTPEVMSKGIGWKGLTKSYTGVLEAYNELDNAKGGYDFYQKRFESSMTEFTENFLTSIMGKKVGNSLGLLYTEGQMSILGIRGQIRSPFAAVKSVQEALKTTNWDVPLGKRELTKVQQETLAGKLLRGQAGFIDRASFNKMTVGDIPIKDYLKEKFGKNNMLKILKGETPIPLIALRNPVETGTQLMFPTEMFVFDNNNRLFKNMPKGLVPSLKFLYKARGDTDGDEMGLAFQRIQSVKDYNTYLNEVRVMNARENEMVIEYQRLLFEHKDSTKAAELTKKMFKGNELMGTKVTESELNTAIDLATNYLDDVNMKLRKISSHNAKTSAYTLEALSREESLHLGKIALVDATREGLSKYAGNIHVDKHIEEMTMRAWVQNIGKEGIGLVASHATRTTIKLNAVHSYLGRLQGLGEDRLSDFTKLHAFANLDFKTHSGVNTSKQILNEFMDSTRSAYDKIQKIFRKPEQILISTKKQISENAGEMMMSLIENIGDIHQERFKHVRDFWGLDLSKDELSAMREGLALHETIAKHDALYKLDVEKKIAYTSGTGVTAAGLDIIPAFDFIRKNAVKLTTDQMDFIQQQSIDKLSSQFSAKTAQGWRNSVKQLLYQNQSKSMMFMGIGLGLVTFFNPNQMTGGVKDFGINLGHRPGFETQSGVGLESLSPEPGQDVFNEKWTHVLKSDPVLKDNIDKYSKQSYKDLAMNERNYTQFNPKKKFKRNYIDHRKQYNARYETNDMRRVRVNYNGNAAR